MKVLTGTDIIEIDRIKESIENLENRFINEIFTEKEIEYCESKKQSRYQHYAARFAAKEALFKAISKLLNSKYELSWKDYEIIDDENGKPHLYVPEKYRQNIENIDVSLSHCKDYATANVSILFK